MDLFETPRIAGNKGQIGGKRGFLRLFMHVSLSLLLLAGALMFWAGAGCNLSERPPQHIVNALVPILGGVQDLTLKVKDLGWPLDAGDLHIVLRFARDTHLNLGGFSCGGDDAYSNWWFELEDTWFYLNNGRIGSINFRVWCPDVDFRTRYVRKGTTLKLEDGYITWGGFDFNIEDCPNWLEDIADIFDVKGYITDLLEKQIFKEIDKALAQVSISKYPVFQFEDKELFNGEGMKVSSDNQNRIEDTYTKVCDTGLLLDMNSARNWNNAKDGWLGSYNANMVGIGPKLTIRVMVKKRPGADPNKPFGYLDITPNLWFSENDRRLIFTPGMFPEDQRWYTFTIYYPWWNAENCNFRLHFYLQEDGVNTGVEWVKVDYIRFHKYDWD